MVLNQIWTPRRPEIPSGQDEKHVHFLTALNLSFSWNLVGCGNWNQV